MGVNHDGWLMNPDETRNYHIAVNAVNGKDYTIYDREKQVYLPTAFHHSFPVFMYEKLIRTGIRHQQIVVIFHVISVLLFAVSVLYFYRIALLLLKHRKMAYWCTATYCFYPSVQYFIGSMFFYESMVLSLLIINIYFLLIYLEKRTLHRSAYVFVWLSIPVSTVLRPQSLFIYFIIALVLLALLVYHRRSYTLRTRIRTLAFIFVTGTVVFLFSLPTLLKNKRLFGEYVLATQPGYELLQGHNPHARGSWMHDWKEPSNAFYQYTHQVLPGIDSLNELEQGYQRRQLAISWMVHHPLQELVLMARKTAIYFMPFNFEVLKFSEIFNPLNLLVHLFFICFLVLQLVRWKFTPAELMVLSPFLASFGLTVIFFAGYRWRYYAEPFMILLAWKQLLHFMEKRKKEAHS